MIVPTLSFKRLLPVDECLRARGHAPYMSLVIQRLLFTRGPIYSDGKLGLIGDGALIGKDERSGEVIQCTPALIDGLASNDAYPWRDADTRQHFLKVFKLLRIAIGNGPIRCRIEKRVGLDLKLPDICSSALSSFLSIISSG